MAYNELFSLGGGGVITDDANATASQILSGYTAYVKGKKITGNIPSQGAQTITPGTSDKTIASGRYLSGTQTIKGDSNLVAGNIKKGTSIFGVSGTYTSDANATAANILSGKTAYVNGSKITGSMLDRTTVGKNGGIGINSSYPAIPVFVGSNPQTGKALDGNIYAAIGVPEGFYTGGGWGYVGVNVNNVNLKAENIKSGVTVFDVKGTYSGGSGAFCWASAHATGKHGPNEYAYVGDSWYRNSSYFSRQDSYTLKCLKSCNCYWNISPRSMTGGIIQIRKNGANVTSVTLSSYLGNNSSAFHVNSGDTIKFWISSGNFSLSCIVGVLK